MSQPEGTIAVVGGRIAVQPSLPGERPPLLDWEDGVIVLVDGLPPAERPHPARFGEQIEASAPPDEPRVETTVAVAADAMEARLTLQRNPGARYRLADQLPNRAVTLRRLVLERIACPAPSRLAVDAAIAAAGIYHGVRRDVLERCVERGVALDEVIAEATRPTEPLDGQLELHRPRGVAAGALWTTPAGAVLAHWTPPRRGEPGSDVFGNALPVREPHAHALAAGEGIDAAPDGRELRAAHAGWVELSEESIAVHPTLRLESLDPRDGELMVHGSLAIDGSVRAGARARVTGDLRVEGAAERCSLEGGGFVELSGAAIGSHIVAGVRSAPLGELPEVLAQAAAELERAVGMAAQLREAASTSHSPLTPTQVEALVAGRYCNEAGAALRRANALAEVRADALGPGSAAALRQAIALLAAARDSSAPGGALEEVRRLAAGELERVRALAAAPSGLVCGALQECDVEVTGDLEILRGAVGCRISASGDVTAAGPGVRGGELRVAGTLAVSELGAPGGAATLVVLGPDASIEAGIVHAGVTIETPGGTLAVRERTQGLCGAAAELARSAA